MKKFYQKKKSSSGAGKVAVVAGVVGALAAGVVVALNTKKGKEVAVKVKDKTVETAGKVKTAAVETAGKVKTAAVETAGKVKTVATETAGKVKSKFAKKADVEALAEEVTEVEVELYEDDLPEIAPVEVEIPADQEA